MNRNLLLVLAMVTMSSTALANTVVLNSKAADKDQAMRLSKALLDVAIKSGPAEAASLSFDELTLLAGCSGEDKACRKKAVVSLKGAKRAVYASVDSTGAITLHVISRDGSESSTPVASEADIPAVAEALLAPPPEPEPKPNPNVTDPVQPVTGPPVASPIEPLASTPTTPRGDRGALGRVKPLSWAVMGVGVGSLATGVVFFALASSKQGEVDDAPTETVDDVRNLKELEDATRLRSGLGFAFVGVGIAALAAGTYLAVRDQREDDVRVGAIVSPDGVFVSIGGAL